MNLEILSRIFQNRDVAYAILTVKLLRTLIKLIIGEMSVDGLVSHCQVCHLENARALHSGMWHYQMYCASL